MNATVRRWIVYGLIVVGTAALFIRLKGMKEPPKKNQMGVVYPTVMVKTIQADTVLTSIRVDGPIRAQQNFAVTTEVQGKVLASAKSFKDGTVYKQGEVLLRINDTDFRLQVEAARSAYQRLLTQTLADLKIDYPDVYGAMVQYLDERLPSKSIKELPAIADKKAVNFLVSRNVYNQYYAIKAQEAQLAKYIITAPFDGVLSNANLNPSAVVRPGVVLGQFVSLGDFEMEVGLSLTDAAEVALGDVVELTSSEVKGNWRGSVIRIGRQLDKQSQMVKAYVAVSGKDLFDGMYLQGKIKQGQLAAVELPRFLLVRDNELLIVKDSVLSFIPAKVVHTQDKNIVVEGLQPGTKVVNQVVSGAYEGMLVNTKE